MRAIAHGIRIRLLRKPELLRLSRVDNRWALPGEALEETVQRIDRIVRRLVFWRRARCFYRAIAIANVLRGCGYPLVVNFGFSERGGRNGRARMHCWLTMDNRLFFEPPETQSDFPVAMGESRSGIRYWSGMVASRQPAPDKASDAFTER